MPLNDDGQVYRSYPSALKNLPFWRKRKLSKYRSMTAAVLDRSGTLQERPDADLQELAATLREQAGNGRPLDDLLIAAFALTREAARRTVGMEHYPVQLLGGAALHFGHVVEMATGEGKTLCATLPAVLNALNDRGVHVVTVNDYLACRDAEEMGPIYRFLGLTVASIDHDAKQAQRRRAYRASITYVTNKEIGFDFLRDEMAGKNEPWFSFGKSAAQLLHRQVHRPLLHFALVDEADSILIDEARTPLILSTRPPLDPDAAFEFKVADGVAEQFSEGTDYTFERKEKRIEWLRAGEEKIVRTLGHRRGPTGRRIDWHECCLRALKAHVLFRRDVEYVVDEGEVVIVDEFTGRKMPGRQWEEGLHQAVECKEGLEIHGRSQTLARTTYQIFFNRYERLAGMTGTAMTDAREIAEIYGSGVLPIPTHRPRIRQVLPDLVFADEERKWEAVADAVKELAGEGRAVLVGTRSIDKSELLSERLKERCVEHVVLNARHEADEAKIVALAGGLGRVTVATNMAGRGTDIKLDPQVRELGGLYVIGTERHESRRVDNQLVGRCGRQGDPGTARFFLSLEDPMLKRYRPKQAARLSAKYTNVDGPIADVRVHQFIHGLQMSVERLHRKNRYQLLKHERERLKYNRRIGVE
jgi:preprotein translocase subunit SecA